MYNRLDWPSNWFWMFNSYDRAVDEDIFTAWSSYQGKAGEVVRGARDKEKRIEERREDGGWGGEAFYPLVNLTPYSRQARRLLWTRPTQVQISSKVHNSLGPQHR